MNKSALLLVLLLLQGCTDPEGPRLEDQHAAEDRLIVALELVGLALRGVTDEASASIIHERTKPLFATIRKSLEQIREDYRAKERPKPILVLKLEPHEYLAMLNSYYDETARVRKLLSRHPLLEELDEVSQRFAVVFSPLGRKR